MARKFDKQLMNQAKNRSGITKCQNRSGNQGKQNSKAELLAKYKFNVASLTPPPAQPK